MMKGINDNEKENMSDKRILLVEDEYLVAVNIRFMLRDAGFEVVGPAVDEASALRFINENGFQAAILDVNLESGKNSAGIASRLNALEIPFILISGYSRKRLPKELSHETLLGKPVNETRLIEEVQKLF